MARLTNREAGRIIDERRDALSRAILRTCSPRRLHPLPTAARDEMGQREMVDALLKHLTVAVVSGRRAVFAGHMSWLKSTLASRRVAHGAVELQLKCIRELLRRELPEDAATLAGDYIAAALRRMARAPENLPSVLDPRDPHGALAKRYLEALLQGQRRAAGKLVLDAYHRGTHVGELYLSVLQPALYELGRLWQANQVSVAEEHYVTAATQLVMGQLFPFIFRASRRNGRLFLATCATGELHEVGLRMVADLLEMKGWDTYYVGPNVPARSIVAICRQQRPKVLGISATMSTHAPAVAELIAAVRASRQCRGINILVGGQLFAGDARLWKQLGADAQAGDGRQAVSVAAKLLAAGKS